MENIIFSILATIAAIFIVRRGVPGLFCSQGFAHQDQGDYAGAERWFLKALSFEKNVQRFTGQRKGLAIVYSNLGLLYHHARRMDEAANMLSQAIAIYSDQGFPQESAPIFASLGKLDRLLRNRIYEP